MFPCKPQRTCSLPLVLAGCLSLVLSCSSRPRTPSSAAFRDFACRASELRKMRCRGAASASGSSGSSSGGTWPSSISERISDSSSRAYLLQSKQHIISRAWARANGAELCESDTVPRWPLKRHCAANSQVDIMSSAQIASVTQHSRWLSNKDRK